MRGPSSRNQVHIFSVIEALEENFVGNNLSVGDADVSASVENKVTGAAVFTSCTVLGCDRGHPEGHWTSTPPSWSLFGLATHTCKQHTLEELHLLAQRGTYQIWNGATMSCVRTSEGDILSE